MRDLNLQERPSAGTVLGAIGALLGLVALVVSLSSSADAAPQGRVVKAGELAPGAVTARAIAPGAVRTKGLAGSAVTAKKLASGAVNRRILAKAAVSAKALANDAVTKRTIAPGSVYGGALAGETIHLTPIADLDAVAANPEWTGSNTEVALCGAGEALLGTGFAFTEPGNREVSFLQASPFLSPTGNGVSGRIASNSGGTAKAQVLAICLGN